jgi:hypothetical protein
MSAQSKHLESRSRLLLMLMTVALTLAVVIWLWTRPNGPGEYRTSPDGKWTAHASNLSRGTIRGDRISYLEIRLVNASSGVQLARHEVRYGRHDQAPDYGDRSQTFITWATNSTHFTVGTTNGATLVVKAPNKS